MIDIEVDQVVLSRMREVFSKPPRQAEKALNKYRGLLASEIEKSISAGRSTKDFHFVSMVRLRKCSELGPAKIRLQNWLEANDLELFKVEITGSNFTNKLTAIKLNHRAKIKHSNLNENGNDKNKKMIKRWYPGIFDLSESELAEQYDLVPVNLKSLSNYIHWLEHDARLIDEKKKERRKTQAERIYQIAQLFGGHYLQKRKMSAFGRVYYEGVSVQNVKKEIRAAMLGDCVELDIRGSAIAWKMGFTAEVCRLLGSDVREEFGMTLRYLEDKRDFLAGLRSEVFDRSRGMSLDDRNKLLKRTINSVGFGARASNASWLVGDEWHSGALKTLYKDEPAAFECLQRSSIFNKFIQEQDLLDAFVYQSCVNMGAAFLQSDAVRDGRGLSKPKVMAYLYQHAETEVMNVACEAIKAAGRTILARVHDAVFINRRLGEAHETVVYAMQQATGNKYWRLGITEVKAWGRPASMLRSDRIAEAKEEQEEHAALLKFLSHA